MSKSDSLENGLLKLIFNGTAIANLADNASSDPLTNLYVGLHTADPGEAGHQASNEISYTGYARTATGRTTSVWEVTGSTASNTVTISFGECTSTTSVTASHFAIGSTISGNGVMYYKGQLTNALVINQGITPYFNAGALTVNEE